MGLSCIGLVVFLLASVIVLGLIPLYIPSRDVASNSNTGNKDVVDFDNDNASSHC